MNAIDLILKDHKRIRSLLAQSVKRATTHIADRKSILLNLSNELTLHEKMEQAIWYPLIIAPTYKKAINHFLKEEHSAEKSIRKLKAIDPKTDKWLQAFKKLKKDVEHHAKDEEIKLLKKVNENVSSVILKFIGGEMQVFKKGHAKLLKHKTKKIAKKKGVKKKSS